MSAKDEFRIYVEGMVAGGISRKSGDNLLTFSTRIAREAAEIAVTPHTFTNNQGGNLVCTECWQDRDAKVHGGKR